MKPVFRSRSLAGVLGLRLLCLVAALWTTPALRLPTAFAQSFAPSAAPTVQGIDIQYVGRASITRDRILANMRTTVGQPFSQPNVEEDIRNLYATGDFSNVRIFSEPASGGVKVIVIVATKATIKSIEFVGECPALLAPPDEGTRAQEGPGAGRGNGGAGPPEAPRLLPRQGLQRRDHQEQRHARRERQLGHDHLHGQRGEREQPLARAVRGGARVQPAHAAYDDEGHARQDLLLVHRQDRAPGSGQVPGRPQPGARAVPEQGLHRHRHRRDQDRAPLQRQHQPRDRAARGAAVPRQGPDLRGHADLHRRGDPALPQDEGRRGVLAQGVEGRRENHPRLLRLARLRRRRGPARGQPPPGRRWST